MTTEIEYVVQGIESMAFTARNGVAALDDGNLICVRQYLEDVKANRGPTLAAARRALDEIAALRAQVAALEGERERIRAGLRYIIRTYNNGAMNDAALASAMNQTARGLLDILATAPAPAPGDGGQEKEEGE